MLFIRKTLKVLHSLPMKLEFWVFSSFKGTNSKDPSINLQSLIIIYKNAPLQNIKSFFAVEIFVFSIVKNIFICNSHRQSR